VSSFSSSTIGVVVRVSTMATGAAGAIEVATSEEGAVTTASAAGV